ncbi:MAG: hypothetical protein PWQ79_2179 [Thermococcaceae archaeon]|nr:hypothetical protein [Thermococcaceae archaeon]
MSGGVSTPGPIGETTRSYFHMDKKVPASVFAAAMEKKPCDFNLASWDIKKTYSSITAEYTGVSGGVGATAESAVTIKWTDGFRVWVSDAEEWGKRITKSCVNTFQA